MGSRRDRDSGPGAWRLHCKSFWVHGINSFQILNSIAEVKNFAQRLEGEECITEEDQRDGDEEDI